MAPVRASRAAIAVALMFGVLELIVPTVVEAQTGGAPANEAQGQGLVPDASFEAMFRKYTLAVVLSSETGDQGSGETLRIRLRFPIR